MSHTPPIPPVATTRSSLAARRKAQYAAEDRKMAKAGRAVRVTRCPKCKAMPGEKCKDLAIPGRTPKWPHAARGRGTRYEWTATLR